MARQIYKDVAKRVGAALGAEISQDAYFERLFKLIPAETIALYLFIEGILKSVPAESLQPLSIGTWLWIVFGIILVLNFLYLWLLVKVKAISQLILLTIAFAVWVFTLGGPFAASFGFYKPFMGSILLALFTFIIPAFYRGVPVNPPVTPQNNP